MALSERTKDAIRVGLASQAAADELSAAVTPLNPSPTGTGFVTVTGGVVNAASKAYPTGTGVVTVTAGALNAASSIAANVPLLGATSNLVGVDGTANNAAPLAGTESRLDAIEAKVDALIGALISAGFMSA